LYVYFIDEYTQVIFIVAFNARLHFSILMKCKHYVNFGSLVTCNINAWLTHQFSVSSQNAKKLLHRQKQKLILVETGYMICMEHCKICSVNVNAKFQVKWKMSASQSWMWHVFCGLFQVVGWKKNSKLWERLN